MQFESASALGTDEPVGDWVVNEPLIDTEILSLALCRFTGEQLALTVPCGARGSRHADVECHTIFFSPAGLASLSNLLFPDAQSEIRRPMRQGEAVGTDLASAL